MIHWCDLIVICYLCQKVHLSFPFPLSRMWVCICLLHCSVTWSLPSLHTWHRQPGLKLLSCDLGISTCLYSAEVCGSNCPSLLFVIQSGPPHLVGRSHLSLFHLQSVNKHNYIYKCAILHLIIQFTMSIIELCSWWISCAEFLDLFRTLEEILC